MFIPTWLLFFGVIFFVIKYFEEAASLALLIGSTLLFLACSGVLAVGVFHFLTRLTH